jgi:signal peptidase II
VRSPRFLFWSVFLSTLILDQATKAWARGAFVEHESPGFPWPGVFELTLTYNKGIAFGMLQGAGVFLAPIAIAIAVAAWMYSHRNNGDGATSHTAMALLASGALGNLYDRVALGKVTDIFWFRAINFPVFNVADTCITVAAGLLILKWSQEFFAEKAKADEGGPESHAATEEAPSSETASSPAP